MKKKILTFPCPPCQELKRRLLTSKEPFVGKCFCLFGSEKKDMTDELIRFWSWILPIFFLGSFGYESG